MADRALWLRWSWRDLRARWVHVAALALVIALGTGTYAALLSTSAWRRASNDASFALLHVHDVRVELVDGTTVRQGTLARIVAGLPDAAAVTGVRERLVVPTQVAVGGVLAPGVLVGSGTPRGAAVDGVATRAGAGLPGRGSARTGGEPAVVVDWGFARQHHLAPTGRLRVAGGRQARYVGLGQSPEYFVATAGAAGAPFVSQSTYAPLFTTLAGAQALTGLTGRVNDVVLTLRRGTSPADVAGELRAALATSRPPIGASVTTLGQLASYRLLYDDIGSDEQLWRVIALLVLAGAAFAALNLTTRVVEAQRREIGIGLALGVQPRQLAVRPLLSAAQVALIGVAFGIGTGELVGVPLARVFADLLPLPVWRTPFQAATFAQAAGVGFVLPFAAAAWPVWRAVRRPPVEALRVGHLAARRNGLAPLLRHLRLPGPGYREVPLRNVLRTPRRSLLTLAGVAAALATLVTIVGLLDTFRATLDRASAELLRAAPDRLSVSLDGLVPLDAPVVAAVRALPEVGRVQPGLQVTGTLARAGARVPIVLESLPRGALWRPSCVVGRCGEGLVVSQKAAADLGVTAGDAVALSHPRAGPGGLSTAVDAVRVAGVEQSPLRSLAFLDARSAARLLGLAGRTNVLTVIPARGVDDQEVQRALLDVAHVTSVVSVRGTLDAVGASLDEFRGILDVASAVALVLVLLIAFNTASIGTDERAREHATMLAFGLPLRTLVAMAVVESVVVGGIGTLLGIALGDGLLAVLTATTVAGVLPEIAVVATVSAGTVGAALLLGLGTVGLAPTLTLRRLVRLDLPSTLRVVE